MAQRATVGRGRKTDALKDNGIGTRWLTYPAETIDHTWALDVTDYDLDDSEKASTVNHYTPLPDED